MSPTKHLKRGNTFHFLGGRVLGPPVHIVCGNNTGNSLAEGASAVGGHRVRRQRSTWLVLLEDELLPEGFGAVLKGEELLSSL